LVISSPRSIRTEAGVGFIGKVLGPLGMVYAVSSGQLPFVFAWNNITNDVIWWIPFFLILRGAYNALKD
jgi:small multidrug resistance pump